MSCYSHLDLDDIEHFQIRRQQSHIIICVSVFRVYMKRELLLFYMYNEMMREHQQRKLCT